MPSSSPGRSPGLALFSMLATLSVPAAGPAAPPRYRVELFPPLDGFEFAAPRAINAAGEIAGYSAPEPFHPLAAALFIDASGRVHGPATPDPTFNFVHGLDDSGRLAGESGRLPVLWQGGKARILARPDGVFSGSAQDVNNDGVVCGSVGDSDHAGPRHCVWSDLEGEPLILQGVLLGSTTGTAFDINDAGQIAGVSGGISGSFFAVRWDGPDAPPIPIGPLPGAFNSEALDLNELGDVVGRSSFDDGSTEAFFFDGTTRELQGLGFLPGGGGYSEARGLNDRRQVVGVSRSSQGAVHAFLWEEGVLYDLNDLAFLGGTGVRYLLSAAAINNAGQIAVEAVIAGKEADAPRRIALLTPVSAALRRGDCNEDGKVDISDAICALNWLFLGGPAPGCIAAVNSNGDAAADISDAVYLLAHLFLGGPSPAAPFPACGPLSLPSDEAMCARPPERCR